MSDLLFNSDYYSRRHNKRIENYVRQVRKLYYVAIDDIIRLSSGIEVDQKKVFSFSDYPSIKEKANELFDAFAASLLGIANKGTEYEWIKACRECDAAINKIMKTSRIDKKRLEGYGSRNLKALEAFQKRKIDGLRLSDRVWNYTKQFRSEMELALDIGIGSGHSAAKMSQDVRSYLNKPNMLFRRVRNKWGNLELSKAAKAYHPGQGVYRSSYKNAIRATRNETNVAYKESDSLRWQGLDFVVGFEVKLSNNHTLNGRPFYDICDKLKGKYPKSFKFSGWHICCRCYSVPILMTPEELIETNEMVLDGKDISGFKSKNEVESIPKHKIKLINK